MQKPYREKKPRIDSSAFIAETCSVVGDVEIGARSSIWYGVTLRGDINSIRIGDETNIQEGSVVHVDSPNDKGSGGQAILGNRVTVGHGAIIHACDIGDECLIGMGAIILSGARIGAGSLVAAGSLVREGQEFPPSSMIAGNPAVVKKPLGEEQRQAIRDSAKHYAELGDEHRKASPF